MKYTSLIAAAAVLSASTYALDAKFGLGVEASSFNLEGARDIGTLPTLATIAANATLDENLESSKNTIAASKEILGLKASASMKMSDRFSLEAGLSINSGKLETQTARSGIYTDGVAASVPFLYQEDISTTIKPTYGFGVKAMFGFNDSFKIGPEVRIQRFETTHSGNILVSTVTSTAAVTQTDEVNGLGGGTINAIDETEVDTTETSFGVAMSGMLNDKIAVNAGYLTVNAAQHEVTLGAALTADSAAMTGGTNGESKFNLESEKPTIDQYYVGLSMNF